MPKNFEYTGYDNAQAVADRLIDYWQAKGFFGIRAKVFPDGEYCGQTIYVVRSNIQANGFPPKQVTQ
jgi:hypothetical protein